MKYFIKHIITLVQPGTETEMGSHRLFKRQPKTSAAERAGNGVIVTTVEGNENSTMATDQSFIQLNFNDRKGASAGTVMLGLTWANQPEPSDEPNVNQWAIVQSSDGFDQSLMSWDGSGLFDAKNWGVMWLWDNDPSLRNKHNNLILWDAPTDRWDCKHLTGGGKVYDPRNPQGKYLTVKWATWWGEKCKSFWQEF